MVLLVVVCAVLQAVSVEGIQSIHKPLFVNKTILCALQGGNCVTDVSTCTGTLSYKCDELSVGLCCMDEAASAKHNSHGGGGHGGGGGYGASSVGYGSKQVTDYSHSGITLGLDVDTINKTVLCQVRGGTCVTTTTQCQGLLKFQCQDMSAGLCCFNNTMKTEHLTNIGSISSGLGYNLQVQVNKTSLCALKGGQCVTNTGNCDGKLDFVCDSLAGGLCCFPKSAKVGGQHGYGYGETSSINKTALCGLKGGVCTNQANTCVGTLAFNCESLNLCCMNTTLPVEVHFRKISTYPRSQHYSQHRSYPRPRHFMPYRRRSKPSYSWWKTLGNLWHFH